MPNIDAITFNIQYIHCATQLIGLAKLHITGQILHYSAFPKIYNI